VLHSAALEMRDDHMVAVPGTEQIVRDRPIDKLAPVDAGTFALRDDMAHSTFL